MVAALALLGVGIAAPAVLLEEYTTSGVLRHQIPIPDRPTIVVGHASRGLSIREAETIAADAAKGAPIAFSPKRSLEAVVFRTEYEMLREGSGWTAKISSARIVFSQREARERGLGGVAEKFADHEALRARRTFSIPDSAPGWRKGVYRAAPPPPFTGVLCHKVAGAAAPADRKGLATGSVRSLLDPAVQLEVAVSPDSPVCAVIVFWGSERVSALAEFAKSKSLTLVSASPRSAGWADVMWTFRCVRHTLATRLGADVPVFAAGFGDGGSASVNAAAWYPDELSGVVADGYGDLAVPGAWDAFQVRIEMPIAYLCGASNPAASSVREAFEASKALGRPALLLEHPGGRLAAPAASYSAALEWLVSQLPRR